MCIFQGTNTGLFDPNIILIYYQTARVMAISKYAGQDSSNPAKYGSETLDVFQISRVMKHAEEACFIIRLRRTGFFESCQIRI